VIDGLDSGGAAGVIDTDVDALPGVVAFAVGVFVLRRAAPEPTPQAMTDPTAPGPLG
jgi:hypothetical protein